MCSLVFTSSSEGTIYDLLLLYLYRPHFPRPTRAGCLYPSTYVRSPYQESRNIMHYPVVIV